MKINKVELVISAVRRSQYPTDNKPEFLLVGRSNVGKSSFINTLINRKNLARTSSNPGKTQTINFYLVNEEFYLSHFWKKLAHLLIVYYLYDSDKTVKAADYANFPIKGFDFYEFSKEDEEILKNDWTIVHDFITALSIDFSLYFMNIL